MKEDNKAKTGFFHNVGETAKTVNETIKSTKAGVSKVTDAVTKPVKDRVESYGKLDKIVKQDMKKAAIIGTGFIIGVLFS